MTWKIMRVCLLACCFAPLSRAEDDDDAGDSVCHDPRHAVRVTKGDRTLHFSICFDCGNTYIRGLPAGAKLGEDGFRHFKDELRDALEEHLTKVGVSYLKAPERE